MTHNIMPGQLEKLNDPGFSEMIERADKYLDI